MSELMGYVVAALLGFIAWLMQRSVSRYDKQRDEERRDFAELKAEFVKVPVQLEILNKTVGDQAHKHERLYDKVESTARHLITLKLHVLRRDRLVDEITRKMRKK
ncbi:MAG: hypothetical protein M3Q97_01515 [Bacteroidota bacterium]|nr:hypothetical protein [Bacteroidota bacterium]